jgi:hypothetical protein
MIVLMRNARRNPPLVHRLLTSLVGLMFVFTMVAAQLPFCQCGITCLHVGDGFAIAANEAPIDDHACCPSERKDDAPAPNPAQDWPCEDEQGCPCPVEISSAADFPAAPLPFVVSSVEMHAQAGALPASGSAFSPLTVSEDAPRWRPTRGSPHPRPPLHVLNSVYLI